MRALVQRPHRKVHFANLVDGAWLTLCDRDLPLAGTAARSHDWSAFVTLDTLEGGAMCRRCYWPLVLAGVAVAETEQRLQLQLEQTERRRLALEDGFRAVTA